MTGGLIDKSIDLPVEQFQFLDETSDRDGPSSPTRIWRLRWDFTIFGVIK